MDETGFAGAVEDWDTRPVQEGYRGLQELAQSSFSGAVEAGDTWMLFINGRALGVYDEVETAEGYDHEPADVDRFDGAPLTAYEAPFEGLPLLFTMQLSQGEIVEQGFTKERPIEDVHAELKEADFTGYLELSEQVVSGDYYVVYQGGRAMKLAFTGPSRRLRTGEPAFERTCEEVGLFEVRTITLNVLDLPEPADTDEAETGIESPAETAGTQVADDQGQSGATADEVEGVDLEQSESEGPTGDPSSAANQPEADTDTEEQAAGAVRETESAGDTDLTDETPVGETSPDATVAEDVPADTDDQDEGDPADTATGLDAEGAERDEGEPAPQADDTVGSGHGALAERIDRLRDEQERLAATVTALEQRLDSPDESRNRTFEAEQTMSSEEALDETTLLVHYQSGSGPTLEAVQAGDTDRDAFAENLQLDPQTPFPPDKTAVDGAPYRTFLTATLEYRFVEWVLTEFTFELRNSDVRSKLADLDDAFPAVARAEFGKNATIDGTAFDVVLRTREGGPLVVAHLEDATAPPSASTTEGFIRDASAAGEISGTLAGAFLVTTSYVDGGAVDPVKEATRGRLLGRDKRETYVTLSSGGYHLCLVEAGDETFHVALPSL